MQELTFLIAEVATLLQLPIDTIRYYEKIGLLEPPKRKANGYRVYTLLHLLRLDEIKRYRDVELSLDDISNLDAHPEQKQAILKTHVDVLQAKIERMQRVLASFQEQLLVHQQLDTEQDKQIAITQQNFRYLGVLSHFGKSYDHQIKTAMLAACRQHKDVWEQLYFKIIDTPMEGEDFLYEVYLEDAQATDIMLAGTYTQRSAVLRHTHLKADGLALKGTLFRYLDTPFYDLQRFDSLIEAIVLEPRQ
ncbi:MAG: MerR family transcriptional regulator [Erysipelotrichaceae bacterium]